MKQHNESGLLLMESVTDEQDQVVKKIVKKILIALKDEKNLTPSKVQARLIQEKILDKTTSAAIFLQLGFLPKLASELDQAGKYTPEQMVIISGSVLSLWASTLLLSTINDSDPRKIRRYAPVVEEAVQGGELSEEDVKKHLGPLSRRIYGLMRRYSQFRNPTNHGNEEPNNLIMESFGEEQKDIHKGIIKKIVIALKDEKRLTPAKIQAKLIQEKVLHRATYTALILEGGIASKLYLELAQTGAYTKEQILLIVTSFSTLWVSTLLLAVINNEDPRRIRKYMPLVREGMQGGELSEEEVKSHLGPLSRTMYSLMVRYSRLKNSLPRRHREE
jgi:hypothetical protein